MSARCAAPWVVWGGQKYHRGWWKVGIRKKGGEVVVGVFLLRVVRDGGVVLGEDAAEGAGCGGAAIGCGARDGGGYWCCLNQRCWRG